MGLKKTIKRCWSNCEVAWELNGERSKKVSKKDIILASKQGSTTCKVFLHYAKARNDSNAALITSDVRKRTVFAHFATAAPPDDQTKIPPI